MAIEVVAAVLSARKAKWAKADLMVLLVMANYADPDGTNIFPSIERLALSCRLKERQVQASVKNLLSDTVLKLEQRANKSGFGGRRTNTYSIDLERVQKMQGCIICGGMICREKGCRPKDAPPQSSRGTGAKNNRGRVQKTARHIDRPVNDPSLTSRASSPRAPDRRGDLALWEKISTVPNTGGGPGVAVRLQAWQGEPRLADDGMVVDLPMLAERHLPHTMSRDMARALGMPVRFNFVNELRKAQA